MPTGHRETPLTLAETLGLVPPGEALRQAWRELPEITERIIDHCQNSPCYAHIDSEPMPAEGFVTDIIDMFRELLFPGYFTREKLDPMNMRYSLGQTVSKLYDLMADLITHNIRHDCLRFHLSCSRCEAQGHSIALELMDAIPETFPINHDDYHAKHIGRTSDGRQFFLTTPFVPAIGGEAGGEFIALFTFDAHGALLDAQIDSLGPRSSIDEEEASRLYEERLASLGDVSFEDIRVAPFKIEKYGVEFGLIPREPEDEDDEPAIEMQPGNYMAFFDPWDGDYDT